MMSVIQICERCEKGFPDHLFDSMFFEGGYITVCPICALAISNEAHGMTRTEFNGTMANEMLTEARAYAELEK